MTASICCVLNLRRRDTTAPSPAGALRTTRRSVAAGLGALALPRSAPRPGTHISTRGADSKGKQELPPALFGRASLFCDLPARFVVIGEFQHVAARHADGELRLTATGEVLLGRAPGRTSTEEITMFDGSGIALQGLCMAQKLVDLLRPGAAFS